MSTALASPRAGRPTHVAVARRGAVMALVAVLIVWPLGAQSDYLAGVAITALVFMILALGLDLVVGRLGVLSFAHPAFFGIGAYTSALLAVHAHASFVVGFLAAIAVPTVVALIVAVPLFRLSLHAFAMGTLGFAQIAWVVSINWEQLTRGLLCLPGVPPVAVHIGPLDWTAVSLTDYYYVALGLATACFFIVRRLGRSRIGRTWTAIRDDDVLAAANGVPVLRYQMLALAVGAGMAGAAGAFFGAYSSLVCPTNLALPYSINLIIILFLGGRGTLIGPVIGAIIFTGLPEYLRVAQTWQLAIYGALIVLASMYLPEGIVTWATDRARALRMRRLARSAPR